MRTDSYWYDDRYNPKSYSHAHRNDSENFPDQEYKDFFGGNIGEADEKEKQHYKIGLTSGQSKAVAEHKAKTSLRDVAKDLNSGHKDE